jgi:hypothetical protein
MRFLVYLQVLLLALVKALPQQDMSWPLPNNPRLLNNPSEPTKVYIGIQVSRAGAFVRFIKRKMEE